MSSIQTCNTVFPTLCQLRIYSSGDRNSQIHQIQSGFYAPPLHCDSHILYCDHCENPIDAPAPASRRSRPCFPTLPTLDHENVCSTKLPQTIRIFAMKHHILLGIISVSFRSHLQEPAAMLLQSHGSSTEASSASPPTGGVEEAVAPSRNEPPPPPLLNKRAEKTFKRFFEQ